VIFALVFALVVAVLFELFDVGAKIRSSRYVRRCRDILSKRTIAQLRKQIAEKEKYRDTFVSDKAIYLSVFRIALAMITCVAAGWSLLIMAHSWPFRAFFAEQASVLDFWALLFFVLTVIGGIQGVRIAQLDTKAKADVMVQKLNVEIRFLEEQLGKLSNQQSKG
jgi:Na+/H+ antiporter NhaB